MTISSSSELPLYLACFLLVAFGGRPLALDVLLGLGRPGLDVLGPRLVFPRETGVALGDVGLLGRLGLQRLLLLGELTRLGVVRLGLLPVPADPFAQALTPPLPAGPGPLRIE